MIICFGGDAWGDARNQLPLTARQRNKIMMVWRQVLDDLLGGPSQRCVRLVDPLVLSGFGKS